MESNAGNTEFEPGNGPTTYNLLYVCSGNTCRSPLARAITERLLQDRGWSHVRVDSAGTAAVQGAPAAEPAVIVAGEESLDLSTHQSKELTPALLDWADLVLVMTPSQFETVAQRGAAEKVALATDFIEGPSSGESIHDPFGGDVSTYRETYTQLRTAAEALLARLEPILAP
jgi:protein-tyrosine-phosphatase